MSDTNRKCGSCFENKHSSLYSSSQWNKKPGFSRCKACVESCYFGPSTRVCCCCATCLPQSCFNRNQWAKGPGFSKCKTCVMFNLSPSFVGQQNNNNQVPTLQGQVQSNEANGEFGVLGLNDSSNRRSVGFVEDDDFNGQNQGQQGQISLSVSVSEDKNVYRTCSACNNSLLGSQHFSNSQWNRGPGISRCNSCVQSDFWGDRTRQCATCLNFYDQNAFSANQWAKGVGNSKCVACVQAQTGLLQMQQNQAASSSLHSLNAINMNKSVPPGFGLNNTNLRSSFTTIATNTTNTSTALNTSFNSNSTGNSHSNTVSNFVNQANLSPRSLNSNRSSSPDANSNYNSFGHFGTANSFSYSKGSPLPQVPEHSFMTNPSVPNVGGKVSVGNIDASQRNSFTGFNRFGHENQRRLLSNYRSSSFTSHASVNTFNHFNRSSLVSINQDNYPYTSQNILDNNDDHLDSVKRNSSENSLFNVDVGENREANILPLDDVEEKLQSYSRQRGLRF